MNHPNTPSGSVPLRMPPDALTTLPPQPTARITTNPEALRTFHTSLPILRFDFPDAASQASFHRAFALLKTSKDKAAFMQRFFDNYDGQVSIPKVPARWDTSNDEAMARQLHDDAPPPPTDEDEHLARMLQDDAPPPPTDGDGELARMLQEDAPPPPTHGDFELARRLQGETPLPGTRRDEEMARRMQEELNRSNNARRPDRTRDLDEDFGRLTFADQRRRPGRPRGTGGAGMFGAPPGWNGEGGRRRGGGW